ncbi:ead/Ea22-like family protein [Serratia marcescens]|uniref:ead/Ea22-like family protein n=1 Tax=Serratia marcescens TaxID=615 RepID=UPI00221FFE0E|nr:ead/Ea22-like family protein [Serratia marcescens]UYU05057.1 ead/Ea22-like family protein [Serratia marcescens]
MDKFSELKAAAMAATPGPWILDDDSWSEGDNANVSTEERYDGRIVSIAQIEGGGSESGFDEPFSTEQQANARYITAANPAVVLALLAELEAKDKRIAELEAKLATPVRLPGFYKDADGNVWLNPVQVVKEIRRSGFTVEGDE